MDPTIDPTTILGYARVSTQRQFTHGHGLERYIEQLKQYGIPEDNIFWDVESGGSDTRKGYGTVLGLVRTGRYKQVVVPLFERFGRSLLTLETARRELVELGVELVVLGDGGRAADLESPDGIFAFQIKAVLAEHGRNYNKFQSIQGHKAHRKKLKAYIPCFGYEIKDGKLVPNHDPYKNSGKTYWQVARELYDLFLEIGETSATIREMVLRYGFERVGHRHHDWPRDWSSMRYWLTNPVLRGTLVYFPRVPNKRIEHPNQHPALITEAEYYQAKAALDSRAPLRGGADMPRNPLAGLVFCNHCGSPMFCKTSKSGSHGHRHYLLCSGAYPKVGILQTCDRRSSYGLEVVDCVDAVIEAIMARAERVAEWVDPGEQINPEVEELSAQIKKLESLNDDDLREAIEVKRTKLQNLIEETKGRNILDKERLKTLAKLKSNFFWATAQQRSDKLKSIFLELVESITVDKGLVLSVRLRV